MKIEDDLKILPDRVCFSFLSALLNIPHVSFRATCLDI